MGDLYGVPNTAVGPTPSVSATQENDLLTFAFTGTPFTVGDDDDGVSLKQEIQQLKEEMRHARAAIRQLRAENTNSVTMVNTLSLLVTQTNASVGEHDALLRAFIATCWVLWNFLDSMCHFMAHVQSPVAPPSTVPSCPVINLYERMASHAPQAPQAPRGRWQ